MRPPQCSISIAIDCHDPSSGKLGKLGGGSDSLIQQPPPSALESFGLLLYNACGRNKPKPLEFQALYCPSTGDAGVASL